MPDDTVKFVAVFIDFENVRYGMLNNHGQELVVEEFGDED